MAAIDPQTAFYIQQAFADLTQTPVGTSAPRPPLTRESIARDVRAAFAELDLRQLEISRRLSPAQRFHHVCEMNRFLHQAVIAAIHTQHPDISESDLSRELLRRMGIRHVPPA